MSYMSHKKLLICLLILLTSQLVWAFDQGGHEGHDHSSDDKHSEAAAHDHSEDHDMPYTDRVMHHIADANEFHVLGDFHIPLPCILYSKDGGLDMFMSSKFDHGHKVVNGYVLNHGDVQRLKGYSGTGGHVEGISADDEGHYHAIIDGNTYALEKPSAFTAMSSWFDFSISKNVFTMMLASVLMFFVFGRVRKSYDARAGQAPKGMQSFFESIIVFLRDEVVKPAVGPQWRKYFPFIVSLFFFILFLNILGLVPVFPGSANVTGNIGVTMALAVITFVVVTVSGNKHYWQHIVWMPGVPAFVKIILTPLEILGIFIKPVTLFIRLFANITAGHIIILSLVGIIFLLGNNGESLSGAIGGGVIAIPFLFVMNILELFVGFLQAFIFALLSAVYIGQAVEEHHHDAEHAH